MDHRRMFYRTYLVGYNPTGRDRRRLRRARSSRNRGEKTPPKRGRKRGGRDPAFGRPELEGRGRKRAIKLSWAINLATAGWVRAPRRVIIDGPVYLSRRYAFIIAVVVIIIIIIYRHVELVVRSPVFAYGIFAIATGRNPRIIAAHGSARGS